MPTITIEVPDELTAVADRRGHASLIELFHEVVADLLHFEREVSEAEAHEAAMPEPPPEVLAEVRRRQGDDLSNSRPVEEVVAELHAKIDRIEAEQNSRREARAKSA